MRRFEFAAEADDDLIAIHAHVFEQDPATAALVVDRIEATIESLCVFPRMGKKTARTNVWFFGGSGKSPFRISYRFDDQTLIVLRVFRSSRDQRQFEG